MSDLQWLSFNIYTKHGWATADSLIVEIFQTIVTGRELHGWYFLRFHDHKGFHVRFRVQVPASAAPTVTVDIQSQIDRLLSADVQLPMTSYRPAVLLPKWATLPEVVQNTVAADVHTVDLSLFGEAGAIVADRLAQESSEITVDSLLLEKREGVSRKSLVPILMDRVQRAFQPDECAATFWKDYCHYWLPRDSDLQLDWIEKFQSAAQRIAASGGNLLGALDHQSVGAIAERWTSALHKVRTSLVQVSDGTLRRPEERAAYFVHMMNNRLGLNHLEEAYFAWLLRTLLIPDATGRID